ncbi:cupin domain-containing protein [Microcella sp.]|uniref:cupin domain-containing protein n=1 Tax=Microcella sp. TaxID=1913979 RepID=UPI00391D2192
MSITIIMKNAPAATLSVFEPKPTSLAGDVREASADLWTGDSSGALETGIWEATPGEFAARRDGFHEICYVISGRATLRSEHGDEVDVEPGDLFVTPAGWVGTWVVHEAIRKVFVIAVTAA